MLPPIGSLRSSLRRPVDAVPVKAGCDGYGCSPPPAKRWGGVRVGVPQQTLCQRSKRPPPPTPPRHAQGRVGGGEKSVHDFTISPHGFLREVFIYSRPLRIEGAGNAGRPMRPIAACAMAVVERTRVSRSHRNHPAFPTQWFTDYTVLSPVLRAFWPPSSALLIANLTPASGCQDHTSSPSASGALVLSAIGVHRIPPHVS
jgi:hypothetical protein